MVQLQNLNLVQEKPSNKLFPSTSPSEHLNLTLLKQPRFTWSTYRWKNWYNSQTADYHEELITTTEKLSLNIDLDPIPFQKDTSRLVFTSNNHPLIEYQSENVDDDLMEWTEEGGATYSCVNNFTEIKTEPYQRLRILSLCAGSFTILFLLVLLYKFQFHQIILF